jgi:hypothetical protein
MNKIEGYSGPLERLDDTRWRIPKSYRSDMRVDGIIYADDALIESIKNDKAPEQVANVACLLVNGGDDSQTGHCQCLACHARVRILSQDRIEDCV